MANFKKLGLTALACLVLSACGSSGGSDNAQPANNNIDSTPSIPTQAVPATGTTPSNPAQSTPASNNTTGAAIVVSRMDNNVNVVHKALTDASNLNVINVDGKEIRIAYSDMGINAGTWTKMNSTQSCCGKFSDVRFGAIGSTGPNENDYIFYNGNPTKVMPTSGIANYNGHFVVAGDVSPASDNEDYVTGSAQFTADFANKTLTGSMKADALQAIDVNAKIDGNNFSGSANSASFSGNANVEGKFFGTNAKELGGLFNSNQGNWGGAFGASQ